MTCVLHCMATLEGGGAERQLCYLAKGLVDKGLQVHVAIIRKGVNYDRMLESGAVIHQLQSRNNYDPRLILQIRKVIGEVKPDVVHVWQKPLDVFGGLAAIITGKKLVIAERTDPSKYAKSLKGRLRNLVTQFASGVVSNSKQGQNYWNKKILRNVPSYFIPNIVPCEEIDKVEMKKGDFPPYAIAVGRFVEKKNYPRLLEAFALIQTEQDDLQLRILGTGPESEREKLENLTKRLGLEEKVIFHGYEQNTTAWLKGAQFFILMSFYEGTPNATMEAAAAGTPLLLSDIDSHREYFDSDSAEFADPFNIDSIQNGLQQVIVSDELRAARTMKAKEIVRRYSRDTISQQFLELYGRILKNEGQIRP